MHTQLTISAQRARFGAHATQRLWSCYSDDPRANPSVQVRRPRRTHGVGLLLAAVGLLYAAPAPAVTGAYCPIPEPGESPSCQAPARERYAEFFAAVESGEIDPAQTAQIEAALSRTGDENGAYLALSSLAYGYYRLAHEVSQHPNANRRLMARLVRWSELLSRLYGAESTPPALRQAVRAAAEDLDARVPAVGVTCTAGHEDDCEAVRGLVGALSVIDEHTSVRSPLSQLVERLLGPADASSGAPGQPR